MAIINKQMKTLNVVSGSDTVCYEIVDAESREGIEDLQGDISEIGEQLDAKQGLLTFDNSPTASSENPVKSGGIYSAIQAEATRATAAEALKVNKPSGNGTSGQVLRTNGDGTTSWADAGLPTDEQTAEAVSDWLDAHPEAVTTVEDGSITSAKLDSDFLMQVTNDYITPQMFNAKGDGSTDDTTAMQAALDEAISTNKCLVIPIGTYKITQPLTVSGAFTMKGTNNFKLFGSLGTYSTIRCNAESMFTASSGTYNVNIDGVVFYSSNTSGIMFDIGLTNSNISNCTIRDFGTVFKKKMGTCHIHDNSFLSVCEYFAYGQIVDSFITNNYINGDNGHNAICFHCENITSTSIIGNYIDYWKYGFYGSSQSYFQSVNIEGNIFDIIWRVFNAVMVAVNIVGNTFTNISSSWFVNDSTQTSKMYNADAEMLAYRPCGFFCVAGQALGTDGNLYVDELTTVSGSTPLRMVNIVGNNFHIRTPLYICKYIDGVVIADNIYDTRKQVAWNDNGGTNSNRINTFADEAGSILWVGNTASSVSSVQPSYIDLLDEQVIDSNARMISSEHIRTEIYKFRNAFKGAKVVYNNIPYRAVYPGINANSVYWYNYAGVRES